MPGGDPAPRAAQGATLYPLLRHVRKENGRAKLMTYPAERSYRWIFWCLALVGFAVDQGSKYAVFHALYNGGRGDACDIIPGAFHITTQFTGVRDPGDSWLSPLRTWGGEV